MLRAEHLEQEPEGQSLAELSPIDQHQADVGSEVFEREKEFSLIARVNADLDEVGDAFDRLDRGEYGRCQTCGVALSDDRLEAVPASRFCAEHQSFWEGVRLSVTGPGGPMPGEPGVTLEDLVELAGLINLDQLPHEDELDEEIEVGPEEAAYHTSESESGGRGGERMSGEEMERAEARYSEEHGSEQPFD